VLVRTVYRIRAEGLDRVPAQGAALVVCNHVSFVDAVVLGGLLHRPARFVMDHAYYKKMEPFFRFTRAIPIASAKEDPALKERAFEEVKEALAEGELVVIFPEGKITRDGELNPFRPGIERILEESPVPVSPVALRGLWGSFFSRHRGRAMSGLPRRFWSKVELVCGDPVAAAQASVELLEEQVLSLRGELR
jgi:1-acyl-sn-glycerol-3-phosphate acyltransferase